MTGIVSVPRMGVKLVDPKNVTITLGNITFTGYTDGVIVCFRPRDPRFPHACPHCGAPSYNSICVEHQEPEDADLCAASGKR